MLVEDNLALTLEKFYTRCVALSLEKFKYNIQKKQDLQNIWIGYSGGLDSRVLLELASKVFTKDLNYRLIAVHINHHLSQNADIWENHCNETCNQLNIEFKREEVIVDPIKLKKNGSLEATLRMERIAIWRRLLNTEDILLLAHHLNDQVETIFLRLLRGTGLKGLSGIRQANVLNGIKIIRPLLNFTKEQILNFAIKYKLHYIEDESNLERKFSRNFLRHEILPKFVKRWPNYLENINRSIKLFQQSEVFIAKTANNLLLNCYSYINYLHVDNFGINNNVLSIKNLLQQEQFLQFEILRNFIDKQGYEMPSNQGIHKIYQEIIYVSRDCKSKLKLKNFILCRYRDNLYIYPENYFTKINLGCKHVIGDLVIISDNFFNSYTLGRAKKIFQKFGIPPWLRKKYPLIFLKNELIAIVGLWIKGV